MEFMDLLFSRYASPMDFMKLYIDQGRFGEFVSGIIEMDFKRKQEEEEKENDEKLWMMYVHSFSDKSYVDWKNAVFSKANTKEGTASGCDADMSEEDIIGIINGLFSGE